MPHVLCASCGLASYAVTPHSAPSLCPYCDADLFPAQGPTPVEDEAEIDVQAA